jgi:dihydropteroate synthase
LAPFSWRYLTPQGLVAGTAAGPLVASGAARWLGGSGIAFTAVSVAQRQDGVIVRTLHPVTQLPPGLEEQLGSLALATDDPLSRLGLAADRTLVMGIVNVTPDSFSDGGRFEGAAGIAHGRALVAAGADLLDIGGESTRPGAAAVPVAEEVARVVPVIAGLASLGVPISIDSRKAEVMAAALDAGAQIVNDVAALGFERADLLGQLIAPRLQFFGLGLHRLATRLEHHETLHVELKTARRETRLHGA